MGHGLPPPAPRAKKEWGATAEALPYKVSGISIKRLATRGREISPYTMHLKRCAYKFREGNKDIPLNMFWLSMAEILSSLESWNSLLKRGYTTGYEVFQMAQKRPMGDPSKFPQSGPESEPRGMMTVLGRCPSGPSRGTTRRHTSCGTIPTPA